MKAKTKDQIKVEMLLLTEIIQELNKGISSKALLKLLKMRRANLEADEKKEDGE